MSKAKPAQPSDRQRAQALYRLVLGDDSASYTDRMQAAARLDELSHGKPASPPGQLRRRLQLVR